jgi:hypothetical protein
VCGSRRTGMTLERTVDPGELADSPAPFRNYADAHYDRSGARTYQRVWEGSPPGRDVADLTKMVMEPDSLVFKLLFSAAPAGVFPVGSYLRGLADPPVLWFVRGSLDPGRLHLHRCPDLA